MYNDSYLSHDGVKGMKWGVRRYQNPDGSLTEEGRIRYGRNTTRSRISSIREQSRANIRVMRAENKERIRYEKEKQKLDLKYQKAKNLEKEKQHERNLRIEKRELAKFKKEHPLRYQQLKKYLTKDGTLNDAGRVRFFGNGEKKTLNRMSTRELNDATYRLIAEDKYRNAAKYANKPGIAAKIAQTFVKAGASFVAVYGGRKMINKATKGKMYKNEEDTIKAAILSMGGVFLSNLGLNNIKTGNPWNDHEYKNKNKKNKNHNTNDSNNTRNRRQNNEYEDSNVDGRRTRYYTDNDGFRYYYSGASHNVQVGRGVLNHCLLNGEYCMITDNYLAHHGVIGMKWGVRRYQNPDGSLTEAGQTRYKKQLGKYISRANKINNIKDKKRWERENNKTISLARGDRVLTTIKAKTVSENRDKLQKIIEYRNDVQKILNTARDKSFDDFMNVDKTSEYQSAMWKYIGAVVDYNKALDKNVSLVLGDMGKETVPGTSETYSEYVNRLVEVQARIRMDK